MVRFKNSLVLLILIFASNFSFSQGGAASCAELEANPSLYQSCATNIPFQNQTTNNAEGIQPSCFNEPIKAPTWFFMKIKTSGDIVLEISQVNNNGVGIDVDFTIWGPFQNLTNICSQLTPTNQVDCSWLPLSVETATIANAIQGELYILMVDNYVQDAGEISITQTGGSGSSDCGFLSSVNIKDNTDNEIIQLDYCKPNTKELKAIVDVTDFNSDPANLRFNYRWSRDGVVISTLNNSLSNNNSIIADQTGNYKVEIAAYDVTDPNVDITNVPFLDEQSDEISLNFYDTPILNATPIVINQCDFIAPNNDGFATIDLNQFSEIITNSNPNIVLKYYLDLALTQEISNPSSFANTIAFNQPIYVVGSYSGATVVCNSATISINLVINPTSLASYPNPPSKCAELSQNFGYIDFYNQRAIIKNTYFPTTTVDINFYFSTSDASLGINPLTNSTPIPTGITTIYVRVTSNNNCVGIGNFTVEIYNNPSLNNPITTINACLSDQIILAIKDTEILQNQNSSIQTSYFYSNNDAIANTNPIDKNIPLNLVSLGSQQIFVRLFNSITQCFSIYNFSINKFVEPTSIVINPTEIISFADENRITITALPPSNEYIYRLDNGIWQTSNVFTNLSVGYHTVAVKNSNGCNPIEGNVLVADYIRFFTPNNDGYNDTWRISGLDALSNAIIYIYDRYGKLIKKIDPSTLGWDGTFENQQLPSDDYWFKIIFVKDGVEKEFRSHFSMKR